MTNLWKSVFVTEFASHFFDRALLLRRHHHDLLADFVIGNDEAFFLSDFFKEEGSFDA